LVCFGVRALIAAVLASESTPELVAIFALLVVRWLLCHADASLRQNYSVVCRLRFELARCFAGDRSNRAVLMVCAVASRMVDPLAVVVMHLFTDSALLVPVVVVSVGVAAEFAHSAVSAFEKQSSVWTWFVVSYMF
jgi:hypothetical protein